MAKKDAREYMPWAGFFCRPTDDGDAFASLPGWRQREVLFVTERSNAKLPWTYAEYFASGQVAVQNSVPVSLPESITWSCLASRLGGAEPEGNMMEDLRGATDNTQMIAHCTIAGEGRRLVNEMPTHGLYAYLWAQVLIHKQVLKTLPLPYLWELEDGIYAITGKALNVRTRAGQQLLAWLNGRSVTLAGMVA